MPLNCLLQLLKLLPIDAAQTVQIVDLRAKARQQFKKIPFHGKRFTPLVTGAPDGKILCTIFTNIANSAGTPPVKVLVSPLQRQESRDLLAIVDDDLQPRRLA